MKSLLILPHIQLENANAISGIVYGFPAITHFLGYVHALSRELDAKIGFKLGGCGIVCHHHQVQAHRPSGRGDSLFSLTRNPLTKDAKTASFNEEGRVRLDVSLVIECDFTGDDLSECDRLEAELNSEKFKELVYELAVSKRLAGGMITNMRAVRFEKVPSCEDEEEKLFRRIARGLLPGFVLYQRSKILDCHLADNPQLNALEGLLDFCTLKSKSAESDSQIKKVKWERIPKPAGGWLVPIQVGYRAISPLYEPGRVACVRDRTVPFRFVEPIYGLGEWVGIHRIRDLEEMMWRYQVDGDNYLCTNSVKG